MKVFLPFTMFAVLLNSKFIVGPCKHMLCGTNGGGIGVVVGVGVGVGVGGANVQVVVAV